MTLEERLENIPTRRLALFEGDDPREAPVHRPTIKLWADSSNDIENGGLPVITICISEMMGQPMRFIELRSDEARELARMLLNFADDFDKVVSS